MKISDSSFSNLFKNRVGWRNLIIRVLLLNMGVIGLIILEQANQNGFFIFWGQILILVGLLGLFIIYWMRRNEFGKGISPKNLLEMGSSIAKIEVPLIDAALTSVTQGDLTRRIHISNPSCYLDLKSKGSLLKLKVTRPNNRGRGSPWTPRL